jgi:phage terminase large subunit-like protein
LTRSPSAAASDWPLPRVSSYPPYPLTAAPEVIDLAARAGLYLDEWQKYVLTHGLGHRVDEQWTATKVSCWVPRQNGKGGIIEALELAWLFLFDEELIVHSAHQHRTSQKAYDRLEKLIRRTPDMHRRVAQYRQANGEQQIELHDGRMLQYTTRSRTAIRGFSANKLVIDEAQELTSEQNSAMMPTVSAIDNHQIWFFGTPPDNQAAWCYGLKEDGEAGSPRLAHFDWGLDLDLTTDEGKAATLDRANWRRTNPAMPHRIKEDTVEDEAKPSGLGEKFGQERLGIWQPRAAGASGMLTTQHWEAVARPLTPRPERVAFAVDINPSRTYTAIFAVGQLEDGTRLVSMVDYKPGTTWVFDRLVELRDVWKPVAIALDAKGPAGAMLTELERKGIKLPADPDKPKVGDLAVPTAQQVASAFALFVDAVRDKRLVHLDEPNLNKALAGAKTRSLVGGTAWDRKGNTDISPLVAATLAYWAFDARADVVTAADYDLLSSFY